MICLLFFLTVVWKRFGFEVSVLMVTFTSIMYNALIYNVEARMYSLAAMFLLLAYYALWLILDNDRKTSYLLFVLASLWADDLSEPEAVWLNDCGYSATEVYHEGMLGEETVHIYQMLKQ